MCACPVTGDAKCDHWLKQMPPGLSAGKGTFPPLEMTKQAMGWSPPKVGDGPDLPTNLHQWL